MEFQNQIGVKTIVINFSQGNGAVSPVFYKKNINKIKGANTFELKYVKNARVFYDKLSEVITNIKNEIDLNTDIEMKRIDAQEKQAAAFTAIANNMRPMDEKSSQTNQSIDYISELKALKELLDGGIITQQEFDEKKAKLLGK